FISAVIAVLLSISNLAWAGETYRLKVDGLACPFCAYGIEKELSRLDGVESAKTDIKSGTVIVTMSPGATLDEAAAKRAVKAAGFTMRGFKRKEDEA
ncbi:MAG: heavy-metal-associated domain-containing protein, partial [Sphingomonadales bacterium]